MGDRGHKLLLLSAAALCSSAAQAQTSCDANNRFTLNWDTQTPRNTSLGTGSRSFTVTNALGASVVVTMTFAANTTSYIDSGFGQTPNISVQNTGGIAAGEFTLFLATDFAAHTTDVGGNTNVAAVRFGFSIPVREVTFRVLDIDYSAGQFRDWVRISGSNGAATYVPVLTSPAGRNNVSNPGVTAPGVTYVAPGTTAGYSFVSGDLAGTGAATATQDYGNILAQFAAPVTQAEVRYGNGPSSTMSGTAGIQSISIHDISFCPLPAIAMTKTVAPATTTVTDPNRFAVPGADVDYTITVANSGGSTVDAASAVITDVLPANVTFYNGDIDTATAGTQNFVFGAGTSGLTLSAANITYLNAGGTAITPAAGYDPLVRTIRYQPQGTMAANSSYSVRLRTRVN